MLIALLSKKENLRKKAVVANLIILVLLSNEAFVNFFQSQYESKEIQLKPAEKYTWGLF